MQANFASRRSPAESIVAKPRRTSAAAQCQMSRSALERAIRDPVMGSGQTPCDRGVRRIALDVAGATAVGELVDRVRLTLYGFGVGGRLALRGVAAWAASCIGGCAP